MSEWIFSRVVNRNFIDDERLKDVRKSILVMYEARNGRRYVKQCECAHGRVAKYIGGEILAWMPLPKIPKEANK